MKCSKCNKLVKIANSEKQVNYYTCDLCFKMNETSPIVNLFKNELTYDDFFEDKSVEMLSLGDFFPVNYSNKIDDLPEPPPFQDISSEESISTSDDEEVDYSSLKSLGSVSYIHKGKIYKGQIDRKTGTFIYYKGTLFTSTNEWVKFISIENI